jgi:hypothetical protein
MALREARECGGGDPEGAEAVEAEGVMGGCGWGGQRGAMEAAHGSEVGWGREAGVGGARNAARWVRVAEGGGYIRE